MQIWEWDWPNLYNKPTFIFSPSCMQLDVTNSYVICKHIVHTMSLWQWQCHWFFFIFPYTPKIKMHNVYNLCANNNLCANLFFFLKQILIYLFFKFFMVETVSFVNNFSSMKWCIFMSFKFLYYWFKFFYNFFYGFIREDLNCAIVVCLITAVHFSWLVTEVTHVYTKNSYDVSHTRSFI
jgi:hypothetical protein